MNVKYCIGRLVHDQNEYATQIAAREAWWGYKDIFEGTEGTWAEGELKL